MVGAILFLSGAALFKRWPVKPKAENTLEIEVNKDRLYADIKFLTDRVPARNAFNLTALNESAAYILAEFKKNITPR